MRFHQHPSNNRVLGAPNGWDQQQIECGALPITQVSVEGTTAMVSFWRPSDDELKALNAGASLRLWVYGTAHPPVALDVDRE